MYIEYARAHLDINELTMSHILEPPTPLNKTNDRSEEKEDGNTSDSCSFWGLSSVIIGQPHSLLEFAPTLKGSPSLQAIFALEEWGLNPDNTDSPQYPTNQ